MTTHDTFEADVPDHRAANAAGDFVVDLDGYAGPLDLLLTLAREQKVDIARISIRALAEQYLAFIESAQRLRLEIAADYLVMAAWLAFLKSRLLLPGDELSADEPTGDELAAALAFQLRRLAAMREAGAALFGRALLGRDVHPRGAPEGIRVVTRARYDASLYDLLQAYGTVQRRGRPAPLRFEQLDLLSIEDALARLERALGEIGDWADLFALLPERSPAGLPRRSALASTLAASLELARVGALQLRQDDLFGAVYIRPGTKRARGDTP